MEPLHIIAIISFVFGALGYIVVQFWIRPIIGYQKIKHRVASSLAGFGDAESAEDATGSKQEKKTGWRASIRKQADGLTDYYNYDLPRWYRMVLQQRAEDPVEASKYLMKLSNTPDGHNALRQVEAVKKHLRIR